MITGHIWPAWPVPVGLDEQGQHYTWAFQGALDLAVGDEVREGCQRFEVTAVDPADLPDFSPQLRRVTLRWLR